MTPVKTLLLVEDEGLVRLDLKESLVEAGFDVSDIAHSGKALSALEADPGRFSGLITDIILGKEREGGWEIARSARTHPEPAGDLYQRPRLGRLALERCSQ
jgi:two-component system, OmpR family, response regulator